MAEERKRKSKAGAPRTEVFAMRLDPKLKYLAEIAARKQRRSLANFMEWAIELGLKQTDLKDNDSYSLSVWDKSNKLWDIDEPDRLANLAFEEPDLMTYDEQILWKLICETGHLWKGRHDSDGDWQWNIQESGLVRERLREYWDKFKLVANGDAEKSILPTSSKKTSTASGFDDFDDIPF
jgi:hypothetical protein